MEIIPIYDIDHWRSI